MPRALVVNFGPETLKLEAQTRDERGQYIEKGERTIPPGQSRYVTISEGESAQLIVLPLADDPQ
jgi:hypothetical protein